MKKTKTLTLGNIFPRFIIIVALGYFLHNCLKIWGFTADDSFITFRYSENLINGLGPTYNSGLSRAEGYTSFLWMIVMAIPHIFGRGVIVFSKVFGILAMLGTMALIYLLIVQICGNDSSFSHIAGAIALSMYALLPETAVHAVSGMETALYSLSLIVMVYLAYFTIRGQQRALRWLPVAGLVNGLIRPEANLLAGIILLLVLILVKERRRLFFGILLFYALPGAVYFIWRTLYYGALLPLPFYIKTGAGGLAGWSYVRDFAIFIYTNLFLYLGLGVLPRGRISLLILTIVLANMGIFLFVFPMMGFDYRFLFPMLSLLLVLTGVGISLILTKVADLSNSRGGVNLPVVWVSILFLFIYSVTNAPRTGDLFDHKIAYAEGLVKNHIAIGQLLAGVSHTNETPVLAVTDAGAIPYFSGWRTIDAGGLNDSSITLDGIDPVYAVFNNSPDVLVLTSNDLNTFTTDSIGVRNLYRSALKQKMVVVAQRPFYQGDSIWVLAKTGSQAAFLLSNWAETLAP